MKKMIVLLAGIVAFAGAVLAATITNQGQVIEVTTFDDMQSATKDTNVTGPRLSIPAVIAVEDVDLTAAEAQAYSGNPGQLLVSTTATGSTKIVYINVGTTNWVLLK